MIKVVSVLITMLIIFILTVTFIGHYLAPDDLAKCGAKPGRETGCHKADAIVAVSGGKTSYRTAEAIALYKNGWADRLIFSGAAQDEYSPSNAEVMRTQAIEEGVPASNIIIEPAARTTHQNAGNAETIFEQYDINQIIVVTSPYHQRRAGLEFQKLTSSAREVRNHPALEDPDWSMWWWLTPRGWWLAGGELLKIGAVQSGNSQ